MPYSTIHIKFISHSTVFAGVCLASSSSVKVKLSILNFYNDSLCISLNRLHNVIQLQMIQFLRLPYHAFFSVSASFA